MPVDPYGTVTTEDTGNGVLTITYQSGTSGATAGTAAIFDVEWTNCTSACTFSNLSPTITNISPYQMGFFGQAGGGRSNGFLGAGQPLWGQTSGGGAYGGGTPIWDPVQAAALRADWDAVKGWKRKRAEVRARRLFRRVVGEIAYKKFRKRGFHELYGASRTRYRLRPGFRVQVMGQGDHVEHELCAHLKFGIPWYDSMAVQALMLSSSIETEQKFKSIANKHPAHGPYPVPEMTEAA